MHPTPTGDRSGGDVIAQAIQTLSQPSSEQIRTVPQSVQAIVAVGIALIAGAFGLRPSYLATLGAVGACTLGVYIVDRFLLDASSFAASTTYSASAGLVAMTITSVFAGVRHLPAWRRFRWKHGEQELAALFIDVEDSTSALGRLQGRDREFLEDIQARIARIVDRNGGHIERTMGDGAFAVFREGTPVQRAERCLSTMTLLAHVFHKEAAGYRKRFGIAPILVLGAEMATVESAVLASRGREEFTTLGRDIAFAQRVQSAAKSFDHRAAIGPRLRTLLTDWTCLGETQELALKGFDGLHPVTEALVTIQGTLDAAPLP